FRRCSLPIKIGCAYRDRRATSVTNYRTAFVATLLRVRTGYGGMAPTVNSDAVPVSASYPALDIACHDVRVFATSSFTLGMAILIASVYGAASIEKIFGT